MVVGVVVILNVADAFPAKSKTLAVDAAVTGFIGALLLVSELIRVIADRRGFALQVLAVVAFSFLYDAIKLWAIVALAAMVVLPWVALLIVRRLPRPAWLDKAVHQAIRRPVRFVRRVGPRVIRYGPLSFGIMLLVLSLFLQLRSIKLSKG